MSRTHDGVPGGTHHERPGDVAPERARAEEKTARRRDLVEVERGENAPAHELQVEIDRLVRESVTTSGHAGMDRVGDTSSGPSWVPSRPCAR
jgi:hypothetical protein